ncbi:MAG: response regulator transcription factor [Hellea sp.]|nr:response regulator transcription factor [Hellea sp.]
MGKTVIIYGLILAVAAFALTWLDYRFWVRDIGFEVYGLIIAVVFAGLGVWIERQRRPAPKENNHVNEKAIKALGLTKRELEMLGALSSGQSNKEIARVLDISPNTVKTHLANLYEKLGVRNRTQAVTKAAEFSLLMS